MRRLRTALCKRMGIDLPIVQAPAGSAVSGAGGLGMLALTGQAPEQARHALRSANLARVVLPVARLIHGTAQQAATTGGLLPSLAV